MTLRCIAICLVLSLVAATPATAQDERLVTPRRLDFGFGQSGLGSCPTCVPAGEWTIGNEKAARPKIGDNIFPDTGDCPRWAAPAIDTRLDASDVGMINLSDVPMHLEIAGGSIPIVIDLQPKEFGIFYLAGTGSIAIQAAGGAAPTQRVEAGRFYVVAKHGGNWVFREP